MAEARATLRLSVDGMTCGNCEQRIERALRALPGVHSARASASLAEVRVRFDPDVTGLEAIRQAITAAGYAVRGDAPAPGPGTASSRGRAALRVLRPGGFLLSASSSRGSSCAPTARMMPRSPVTTPPASSTARFASAALDA